MVWTSPTSTATVTTTFLLSNAAEITAAASRSRAPSRVIQWPSAISRTSRRAAAIAYISRGDGTFAESAYFSGVAASEWSWSSVFLDVDLDGWEDILVTNGFEFDTTSTPNKIGGSAKSRRAKAEDDLSFPAARHAQRRLPESWQFALRGGAR